jgi:membrane fusion protein (multidrug efflux system)
MTPDFSRSPRRASPLKWILLLVVVAAVIGFFFFKPSAATPEAESEAKTKADAVALPLELSPSDYATVEPRPLVRRLPLSGSLTPLVQTTIKARVSGELLSVEVREGMAVQRGQTLARIDTRNQQAQVASQRAGLEKAKADLALAKLNLENNQRLLQKNFIAQNVLDTSQSTYESAVANVKLAEAQLQLAEIGLHDAVVRAPFSAVVSRRLAEPGEKVSVDSPLLGLVDLAHLELQAAAPATEVPLVQPGQIAEVRVDGFGDRRFKARVERINPAAEQGSRSIMLYLSLDNAEGLLKGGMFAQGELVIEQSAPAPAIPLAAVRSEAGLDYVLAIVDGKLVQTPVKLGLRSEDAALVEVREGLAVGAQVLVTKAENLKPGAAVLLKAAPAGAAAAGGH